MIISKDTFRKYTFWQIAFIVFVIWSAGGATEYQTYLYSPNHIATIPILFMCFCFLYQVKREEKLKNLIWVIFFLLVWGTLGSYMSGYNCNYFYLIYNIFLSYTICKIYGKDLFVFYENIVTVLSCISVIAFLSVILMPPIGDLLKTISVTHRGAGLWESNVLLFGIQQIDYETAILFGRRNLGFAWEPGRFAVIVVIALFFNLIINQFKLRKNKNFWILFITLITTQSTTGYGAAVVLFLLYFYNSKYKSAIVPVCITLFLAFSSLSFMNDKIANLWNWQDNQSAHYFEQMMYYADNETNYVPQRFEGMFYDILNFIHSPLWGYGQDFTNSYVNTILFPGARVYSSDGLVQIFSSAGVFVALFLYVSLYKSSSILSKELSYQGAGMFLVLFALVNVSYNFWSITIFTSMVFYSLFKNEKGKYYNSNL